MCGKLTTVGSNITRPGRRPRASGEGERTEVRREEQPQGTDKPNSCYWATLFKL